MSNLAPFLARGLPAVRKAAPWVVLAAAIHVVGAPLFPSLVPTPERQRRSVAALPYTVERGPRLGELDEFLPEIHESRPMEELDRVVQDPVIKDAKLCDSDAPFEGPGTNGTIGIGGGAGGQLRFCGVAEDQGSGASHDREGYDAITENRFRDPRRNPLSTFSADVDTASYANVRRILREGRLPPPGAVRIEELINYFSYADPVPEGAEPFSVTTEVASCPWDGQRRLLRIGIRGRTLDEREVPARNLVFLIDVSGSMSSRDKLPLVVKGLELLVAQLRAEDRISLVVYAGASGVVLEPTPGSDRQVIRTALRNLRAGGSTNGGAGIERAYALAREHFAADGINRVILATDGDFNVGTTDRSSLEGLIEKERESGVFLTVLGVGRGNVRDSQMEMLADKGNGNYHYLDSLREAGKVLVEEAGGTLVTIAKDVKFQVEFNPQRVGAYRLVGYENRLLAARDFADDTKDAGEIGAGHSVTALYEITFPGADISGSVAPLRYQSERPNAAAAHGDELATVKLRYKEPDGTVSRLLEQPVRDPGHVAYTAASRPFRWSVAVATFGRSLRPMEGEPTLAFSLARELTVGALGEDPHGHRAEFVQLVARAEEVARSAPE